MEWAKDKFFAYTLLYSLSYKNNPLHFKDYWGTSEVFPVVCSEILKCKQMFTYSNHQLRIALNKFYLQVKYFLDDWTSSILGHEF